jgi:NAD(P)-dependent dehydrogenase (short-subunit alcohol dehydrogenase family)
MLTSRKADDLAASAATIDGEDAWTVANAGDEAAAARAVSTTLECFGAVDILVNNAATNPCFGPMIVRLVSVEQADRGVLRRIRLRASPKE